MERISAGEAIRRLKAEGWERIASVMSDDQTRGENYGLLFARGIERFWLNKDSVNALPPARHDAEKAAKDRLADAAPELLKWVQYLRSYLNGTVRPDYDDLDAVNALLNRIEGD